jgi:hypothetical protein
MTNFWTRSKVTTVTDSRADELWADQPEASPVSWTKSYVGGVKHQEHGRSASLHSRRGQSSPSGRFSERRMTSVNNWRRGV